MTYDVAALREEFPILAREAYGKPLVYLDNAASAQKRLEEARKKVAAFLNAASPDEIVFTSGGTDAFNLVAYSLGVSEIGEGDEIILSLAEHHSNIVPWHMLRERKGAVLKWLDVSDDGDIDLDAFAAQSDGV